MITLNEFRIFMRELNTDLDPVLQQALDSAHAEAEHFLGFGLYEYGSPLPSDVVMAVLLLGQAHADAGDQATAEGRRGAAQKLLTPYRANTGFGTNA